MFTDKLYTGQREMRCPDCPTLAQVQVSGVLKGQDCLSYEMNDGL